MISLSVGQHCAFFKGKWFFETPKTYKMKLKVGKNDNLADQIRLNH
jgi:hypothetical protein